MNNTKVDSEIQKQIETTRKNSLNFAVLNFGWTNQPFSGTKHSNPWLFTEL